MSELKNKICADFLVAYKTGQKELKNTLGMLKSLITECEKLPANIGKELTDAQVLEVIQSYDKNLDKSLAAIGENDTVGLFLQATQAEKEFIKPYLPKQMTDEDMLAVFMPLLHGLDNTNNRNKVLGTTMNHFKQMWPGQYNAARLKELVDVRLNEIFA